MTENLSYSIDYPISIVYTSGCEKSLEVVNFCKDNNLEYRVLEYKVDEKEKALRAETPYRNTPIIFDNSDWLIADYNTYKTVLGGTI